MSPAAADTPTRPQAMAVAMLEALAEYGDCRAEHLIAAGFTTAELIEYADEARAIANIRFARQDERPKPVFAARIEGEIEDLDAVMAQILSLAFRIGEMAKAGGAAAPNLADIIDAAIALRAPAARLAKIARSIEAAACAESRRRTTARAA